jgi:GntR family transcriptional regulator/GntR family frlABCD operon transcriptional regulator
MNQINGTIRYLEVEKDLRKSIIAGVFDDGDILPSENDLCSQYGISRMTVRKALNNLELEGLIDRRKGKGSFVKFDRSSIELLSIKGFTEIMKSKEHRIETLFLKQPLTEEWDDSFYWDLSSKEYDVGCIHFSRVRKLEGKPIMFEKTYLPNELKGFCEVEFVNQSLFDTLVVKYDIEIKGVVQKFRAISADLQLAELLRIEVGDPVLEIKRKLDTNKPDFYIYSFAYCNTENFTIET